MDKGIREVTTRLSMFLLLSTASGAFASDVCDICDDLPNPFAPVEIHKASISSKWRKPFHDISKTFVKYFEVFPDDLDGFEYVEYHRLRSDPAFYLDRRITTEIYFAKPSSFYRPFVSSFNQDSYSNFSAWPYGAELWTKEGRSLIHPLFYVDRLKKDLNDRLTRLPMFTPVKIYTQIRGKTDGMPWFEVVGFEVIKEPALNETALRHMELGYLQLNKKRYDMAAQALEDAVKLQLPLSVETKAYAMLGRAYSEMRWYPQARCALVNAVLRDKSNVTSLILLARADLKLDKPEEARQAAELAITLEPSNASAHAELGLALAMLDDIRGGYKAIEFAQRLSRNQLPEANRNRAMIALREGKLELARNELNQAVILRPTDVDLKLELGDVYLLLNDVEKARLEFNQAKDLALQRPEPYYKIALLLKKQADALKKDGKTEEANKLYTEALDNVQNAILKDDTFTPAYGLQAEILRSLGRVDDATRVLQQGAKIKGNSPRMQEYFYQQAAALGDWEGMEKSVRNLISMRPNGMLYSRLGNILANRPEPDMTAAADAYEKAVSMAPDRADDWTALGYIRVNYLRDYVGAQSALKQAVQLQPQDAAAWFALASAERNLGNVDDAISAADEAVKIDPTVKARLHAALARMDRGTAADVEAAADIANKAATDASASEVDKAWAQAIYAATLMKSGKYDEAVNLFPKADMLQTQSSEYNLWYGMALAKAGALGGAEEHFRSAMEISQPAIHTSRVAQRVYTEAQAGIKDLAAIARTQPKQDAKEPKTVEKIEEPAKTPATSAKKGAPVIEEPEKSQPVPVEVPGPR